MFDTIVVTQPTGGTNLETIADILRAGDVDTIDIAAAYATESGVDPLVETLRAELGGTWATTRKRWVVAFDYLRTQPNAADRLAGLPRSEVRIQDAAAVLMRKGAPRRPFHPKTFLFGGANRTRLFTGSGNISRSGLTRGHEVGVLLDHGGRATVASQVVQDAIGSAQTWFDGLWAGGERYLPVAADYRRLFDSQPNLRHPTPTEDDTADYKITHAGLKPQDLIKLRVCQNLWIEVGKVTKNRGALPGNQLMMKRMTRVFFGMQALDVPINTTLAVLSVSLAGGPAEDRALSFSDNNMDKITLPVPDAVVGSYNTETLHFERLGGGRFNLNVMTNAQKRAAKAKSTSIGASFVMNGGREWGVF